MAKKYHDVVEELETIEAAGAPHDCLLLTYAGGDKLYLPVENIEMLSRYGAAEATEGVNLDRLGSGNWQARRAKLKQRLRDMADALVRVADWPETGRSSSTICVRSSHSR